MKLPLTTHLVCAPDDLPAGAQVAEWLIQIGDPVWADTPLLRLDGTLAHQALVHAPLDGVLGEHCVQVGEVLSASALIAMIEAEEPPTGSDWLIPAEDAEAQWSVPACKLTDGYAPPRTAPLFADDDVMQLCAALGLAPDEITHQGALSKEAVFKHVRKELRLLAALREMLDRQ